MLHTPRIARVFLATAIAVGAIAIAAPAMSASAFPVLKGYLGVTPDIGHAGSVALVTGSKFAPNMEVSVSFVDKNGLQTVGGGLANAKGRFTLMVCIPSDAAPGLDWLIASSVDNSVQGSARYFIVKPKGAIDLPNATGGSRQTATHRPDATGGPQKATDGSREQATDGARQAIDGSRQQATDAPDATWGIHRKATDLPDTTSVDSNRSTAPESVCV